MGRRRVPIGIGHLLILPTYLFAVPNDTIKWVAYTYNQLWNFNKI